jgi:hypothetical protein
MGAGRLVTLLLWVLALFGPTVMMDYWVGGLSTALRPGLKCWGAWSPSLDGDLNLLTGVKRVGLACAWGTIKTCVFRGT